MEALGPQLASRPTPPHKAEEVFRYLFALDDLSNDEFLICRRRDYHSSIRLPTSMWGAGEDADLRSRPSRKVEAVAAATAEKKSVVAKKDKTTGRAVLTKRPRQEAEPAIEPPPPAKRIVVLAGPYTADRGKRLIEEPTVVAEPLAPSQDQDIPASSEAAVPVGSSTADRAKRPAEEPEATTESPVHPQDQGFHIPPQEVTSAFASWEVEFKALISSTTAESGPSAATTEAANPNALTQLREVLSLSTSQVLERNGLDLLGVCLNDLGADGRLSGYAIVRSSSALERVRETFSIFQTALKAEHDLQAATAVQDTLRLKIDDLRAKGEALAELDRQMAELAKRRSAIASELAKDFESGGKDCLTEYAATTKWVERLKLDKRNRQAEVIMAEVRWLELKALLGTLLPSSP
ncbi:unnamed protein product [Malus baccata var. baccata]